MDIGKWYSYNGTPASSTSTHKAGIDVMVVSQNQINNTSLVRIRPWIMKLSGSGFWNTNDQTMTIKANNVSRTTKTNYDFREATTDNKEFLTSSLPFRRVSGSGSLVGGAYVYDFTITHNNDGSKTIPIYALIPLSSTYGTNWTVNQNIELPKIPRSNTATYSYTTLGKPITISINKSSASFTTTVSIMFSKEGTSDKFADKNVAEKTTETELVYNMSETFKNALLGFNKKSQKVTAYLTLYTYTGDTLLATKEYSFVLPLEKTPPVVSATYEDTNATTITLTGNSSKIIKYVSQPKVTITATPQQMADIVSYSTIWGNSSSTTQETTFTNGIDSNILQVSAKDSRNWVGNISYDITENYIDYIKLGFEKFTLERPETTSNTINADLSGVWFNGNFGVSNNTLELKFRYKEKDGEYGEYQTISLTTDGNKFSFSGSLGDVYNYQKQYDFEFILSDKIMSLVATFNVTSGESILRVGETYVRILGDVRQKGNYELEGSFKINGRNIGNGTLLAYGVAYNSSLNSNLVEKDNLIAFSDNRIPNKVYNIKNIGEEVLIGQSGTFRVKTKGVVGMIKATMYLTGFGQSGFTGFWWGGNSNELPQGVTLLNYNGSNVLTTGPTSGAYGGSSNSYIYSVEENTPVDTEFFVNPVASCYGGNFIPAAGGTRCTLIVEVYSI